MIKFAFCLTFFFVSLYSFGQEKVKDLPEVRIELDKDSIPISGNMQVLTSKNVSLFAPEDVGSLLQKVAGITLKNYGGIGGMKTIAFRGITGTNTAIVLDGFTMQNTMVGQIDLSNLQVDNIQTLTFTSGIPRDELVPISALMQGNILSIKTTENLHSIDTMEVRLINKIGSFGQYDSYASFKRGGAKSFVSVFGKYRTFVGNYPYSIENGSLISTNTRKNNQLQEGFGGVNYGRNLSQHWKIRASLYFNQSQRGLPGAVILYNETANQQLYQQNTAVNYVLGYATNKGKMNMYNSLNYGYLNYLDPSYLNNTGGLNQWYFNTSNQTGVTFQRVLKDSAFSVFGGVEHTFSGLVATNQFENSPKRFHVQSLVGLQLTGKKYVGIVQVGNHLLQNQFGKLNTNKLAWTSFAQIEKRKYHRLVGLPRIWLKQTFRMPSFSELYYNTIGNKILEPELTLQFSAGTSYHLWKNTMQVSLDTYYNKVLNKILAIPTKNLFVWSVMNVGKVQVFGCDMLLRKNWTLLKKNVLDIALNYSYQRVQDISDEKALTYKNQLAYSPIHSLQTDLTFTLRSGLGLQVNNSNISDRFVLNENKEENRLRGFSTVDCTLFSSWNIRAKHKMKICFTVKNCTNQSYQYISYFVMPGRNYLVSLNYAFN